MTVAATPESRRSQLVNLLLGTWVSVICFWAWNLVGPLSTQYATRMSLSSNQQALLGQVAPEDALKIMNQSLNGQ